jgi:hypothetical protein
MEGKPCTINEKRRGRTDDLLRRFCQHAFATPQFRPRQEPFAARPKHRFNRVLGRERRIVQASTLLAAALAKARRPVKRRRPDLRLRNSATDRQYCGRRGGGSYASPRESLRIGSYAIAEKAAAKDERSDQRTRNGIGVHMRATGRRILSRQSDHAGTPPGGPLR